MVEEEAVVRLVEKKRVVVAEVVHSVEEKPAVVRWVEQAQVVEKHRTLILSTDPQAHKTADRVKLAA